MHEIWSDNHFLSTCYGGVIKGAFLFSLVPDAPTFRFVPGCPDLTYVDIVLQVKYIIPGKFNFVYLTYVTVKKFTSMNTQRTTSKCVCLCVCVWRGVGEGSLGLNTYTNSRKVKVPSNICTAHTYSLWRLVGQLLCTPTIERVVGWTCKCCLSIFCYLLIKWSSPIYPV